MRPRDSAALELVLQDADSILRAMGNTPIADMDATFYAHYAEELRMVVEDVLAVHAPARTTVHVWLLWNGDELAGCHDTESAAQDARADLQHQLLCDYGPDTALLESITITAAVVSGTQVYGRAWRR